MEKYYEIIKENMDIRKVETWEWIIQEGIDIHADDEYALRWASENGHLEVVKLLLENGANVHAYNDYALRLASEYGHLDVVKYLNQYIKNN